MKKEATCNIPVSGNTNLRAFTVRGLKNAIDAKVFNSIALKKLAELYSFLSDEPVSPRQALKILNATTAATLFIFSAGNLVQMLLLGAWAVVAYRSCK